MGLKERPLRPQKEKLPLLLKEKLPLRLKEKLPLLRKERLPLLLKERLPLQLKERLPLLLKERLLLPKRKLIEFTRLLMSTRFINLIVEISFVSCLFIAEYT